MSTRLDRTGVKLQVVHHLGDGLGPTSDHAEVMRRANPHGYEFPEYDYAALADGSILNMRPLDVIGAHTIADRPAYMRGDNWWNCNSASIVMANDNTKFAPPAAMVEGLAKFLAAWIKDRGASLDFIYPHFQVTMTDCPGASYAKVGLNTGFFNYDGLESWVTTLLKGGQPSIITPDHDIYLSVRVLESKADGVIRDIIKMGYACKKLDLA